MRAVIGRLPHIHCDGVWRTARLKSKVDFSLTHSNVIDGMLMWGTASKIQHFYISVWRSHSVHQPWLAAHAHAGKIDASNVDIDIQMLSTTSVRTLIFETVPTFTCMWTRGSTFERCGVIDGIQRFVTTINWSRPQWTASVWTLLKFINAWYRPIPHVQTTSTAFECHRQPSTAFKRYSNPAMLDF